MGNISMLEKYLHKISARIVKFLMIGTTSRLCYKAVQGLSGKYPAILNISRTGIMALM